MGILGSITGGGGSGAGSKEMLRAIQRSLDMNKQMYDQTRADQMPWYAAGTAAINRLSHLTGTAGKKTLEQIKAEITPSFYMDGNGDGWAGIAYPEQLEAEAKRLYEAQGDYVEDEEYGALLKPYEYEEDPGYQFALKEGEQAINRKLAASGKTFTPEAVKALNEYGTGVANQNYNDGFTRDLQTKNSIYGILSGQAGMGQSSANVISASNEDFADDATELNLQTGNVQAAAAQAKAAGRGSMFNTLARAGIGAGIGYATGGWAGAAKGALGGLR